MATVQLIVGVVKLDLNDMTFYYQISEMTRFADGIYMAIKLDYPVELHSKM